MQILSKELRVQGILVNTFGSEWPAAFAEMNTYIQEGKLKTKETEYDFENMREAFYGLFKGDNTGKAVVKYTPK
jgi:NADPH-dependent curcumin reductase CurA